MNIAKNLLVPALVLIASFAAGCGSDTTGAGAGAPQASPLTGKELAGHWVSKGCESYPDGKGGNNYLTRDFTLTADTWDLSLTIFGDPECKAALFSSKIHGPYTLGELSSKVDGATEGQFGITENLWTAHVQAMADTFAASGCGTGTWEIEKAQDVAATGCIGVAHETSKCPEEHDIVAVDGDALYFGQRVTDMCTEEGRPTARAPYAVYKQ